MTETVKLAGIVCHSFVDGPGIRFTVFFQGCPHNCQGCHNPETHDINGGKTVRVDDVIEQIGSTKYIDGITLSGGDPLMQAEAAIRIADFAHQKSLNVWCYTGYTLEQIIAGKAGKAAIALLPQIDCLVDGPYIAQLRSEKCIYRGSTNQRLIKGEELKNAYQQEEETRLRKAIQRQASKV